MAGLYADLAQRVNGNAEAYKLASRAPSPATSAASPRIPGWLPRSAILLGGGVPVMTVVVPGRYPRARSAAQVPTRHPPMRREEREA